MFIDELFFFFQQGGYVSCCSKLRGALYQSSEGFEQGIKVISAASCITFAILVLENKWKKKLLLFPFLRHLSIEL